MNARVSLLIVLMMVAFIPHHVAEAQGHRIMKAVIETESGTRTVEIRYYAGSEEWAKDVFTTIREGFPLLEKKIGVPCPVSWDILVTETTSLKAGVAGVNKGPGGLEVPTGTSATVIVHELCHYWFGHLPVLKWSNWILEGFPEAYTIAVLRELDHPGGYAHWYARLDQYEETKTEIGDKPLSEVGYSPDFEDPRVAMLYSKAMVFSSWLLVYFEEEAMHKINEQIIFMNPLRSEDYQEIAEEIQGEDLDWLFSGWVYPGEYYYDRKKVSFEWFAGDGDKDGIPTLQEIKMGSSPFVADSDRDGLTDGYELLLGTDPDNPDTDEDGLKDGEEVPISMDGKNTEWETPIITDEADDSLSPTPEDIKALYYASDDRFLYFMIEFYHAPTTAHHNGVQFDVDTDGKVDFIFFSIYDHVYMSIWEEGEWVETILDPKLLQGTYIITDKVVEMRIPRRLRYVTFPESFAVWAYEFSLATNEVTDTMEHHMISLSQNALESTHPMKSDTDGDGLLDGEDVNPLTVDVIEPEQEEEPVEESVEEPVEEDVTETVPPLQEPLDLVPEEPEKPDVEEGTHLPVVEIIVIGGAALLVAIILFIKKAS